MSKKGLLALLGAGVLATAGAVIGLKKSGSETVSDGLEYDEFDDVEVLDTETEEVTE